MNSNDITLRNQICPYRLPVSIINGFIQPVFSLLGIFLNFLSVILFLQLSKKNNSYSNMLKYLLIMSTDDGMRFIIISFSSFYFCLDCEQIHSYETVVWFIYFYLYSARSFEMSGSFMEVMATFECYIRITERLKFFHSKSIPIIVIPLLHLISFIYEIPYFFEFKIVPLNLNNFSNQTVYFTYSYTGYKKQI